MKITSTVSNIELSNIVFGELKGAEFRCAESMEVFENQDKVIVVSAGTVKDNSIELDSGIYFIKEKDCEQFFLRFVDNLQKKSVNPPENA